MTIEPKRSDEYLHLLEELKESFTAPVEIANKLFEKGKQDGLSNDLIRKDIESTLAGVIKERQLRRILPLELKRKYTIEDDSALSAELAASSGTEGGTITYNHPTVQAFKEYSRINQENLKAKILKMAEDIDKSGKISKEGIGSEIVYLLYDELSKGDTITTKFVLDCLPAEYKRPEKGDSTEAEESKPKYWPARFTFHDSWDFCNCCEALLSELSPRTDIYKADSIPLQRLMQESRDWQVRMLKSWNDDRIYMTLKPLIPLAGLLMAFAERMEEEARIRRRHYKDGLFSV